MKDQKCISLFVLLIIASKILFGQQIADTSFNYPIKKPLYKKEQGPVITLDEAHFNFHTLDGRYFAFGRLLKQDGYILKPGHEPFTTSYLLGTKILVIANALPDSSEWKLPTKSAFLKQEISELQKWVFNGGNLFLIADHMPFAGAAAELALSFGFNFINGFAFRKDDKSEIFSRKKNNLTSNIITNGKSIEEHIDSMMIFTGQAFLIPDNAVAISRLDDDYTILLSSIAWEFNDSTASISGQGFSNGAFMNYGKGRLVIFGEAAMFSAQLAGSQQNKMGMNNPTANQNPQLLLNIIHWLDRKL